ncbi:peptide chain release factor N(5)-glutamine methyltransferase [Vampirovibrio sp.]|uniref:peptide chain release factor N(5)-glutamine methyltransferase n=1 Tax=Vampirovibrio sp. TaxID=2717857 RepID=UPI0035946C68
MTTPTHQELYRHIRESLLTLNASPAQAEAEALWILQDQLGITPEALYRDGSQRLTESETAQLNDLLYQRTVKRIPLQYLLHEASFFGLKFYVNPHVLIPRPETELLVEQALLCLKPGMRVLDVGTGPGTIALSLAHQLSNAVTITAVDCSPEALLVAKINQKKLGVTVRLMPAGDLFAPIGHESFDLIVSNPPYIDPQLKPSLSPEVLNHEPHTALFPPHEDAYYFYQRLAAEGKNHLTSHGKIIMECGAGMSPSIGQILMIHGYKNIEIIRDYAGLDRVIMASLSAEAAPA